MFVYLVVSTSYHVHKRMRTLCIIYICFSAILIYLRVIRVHLYHIIYCPFPPKKKNGSHMSKKKSISAMYKKSVATKFTRPTIQRPRHRSEGPSSGQLAFRRGLFLERLGTSSRSILKPIEIVPIQTKKKSKKSNILRSSSEILVHKQVVTCSDTKSSPAGKVVYLSCQKTFRIFIS